MNFGSKRVNATALCSIVGTEYINGIIDETVYNPIILCGYNLSNIVYVGVPCLQCDKIMQTSKFKQLFTTQYETI